MKDDNLMNFPDGASPATEEAPPPELERRVVSALKAEGLLSERESHTQRWRIAAAAAAICLMGFAGGLIFQKHFAPAPAAAAPAVSMSENTFVLFLMEDSQYRSARTASEQQQRVQLYRDWAIDLRNRGIPVSGAKLRPEISFVSPNSALHAGSGIAGYFLVDAENETEALRIARTCPHLQFGGKIELRRIDPV